MTDLDTLESLSKAAGGNAWQEDGYIIFEDWPETKVLGRVDVGHALCGEIADFWAAAHPAAILALIAEVRELRKDKARLDSGRIIRTEYDEFGDRIRVDSRGNDLRKMIDVAMEKSDE
jgi:hypothetical protein